MTIFIPVSNTLSAAARIALLDHLNSTPLTRDLLDVDFSPWSIDQSEAAAKELEDAGYGKDRNGTFEFDFELRSPAQLPTDNLDELVPALHAVDGIVQDADRRRSPEQPNPVNELGCSLAVLLQLQNVLRLAVYGRQGRLSDEDVARQLPAVATMLAQAVRAEVAV